MARRVSKTLSTRESIREIEEHLQDLVDEDDLRSITSSSSIADTFQALSDRVSDDPGLNEALQKQLYRSMLMLTLGVIPKAEAYYRKERTDRAAYALNALVSQARELVIDLRMVKDVDTQVEYIKDQILMPVFKSFTQVLLQEVFSLKNKVDTSVTNMKLNKAVKSEVDVLARALGTYQTNMIELIASNIDSFLTSGNKPVTKTSNKKRGRHAS